MGLDLTVLPASDVAAPTANQSDVGSFLGGVKDWLKFGIEGYATIDALRKGHVAMGSDGSLYDPMNNPTSKPLTEVVKNYTPLLIGGAVLLVVVLMLKD